MKFRFRISGLDPAGNGFFPPTGEKPVNRDDADFVDLIHTDVFYLGSGFPTGHADFFPDYGLLQPSCPWAIFAFFDPDNCE